MYTLNSVRFHEALKEKGYRSVSELAESLGLHRNTIQYYLSGRELLPRSLEKVIEALDLRFEEIAVRKKQPRFLETGAIASFVDHLHAEFPELTFVLMGSRAKGKAKKYSDWDIGVFSRKGMSHSRYRQLVSRSEELAEDLPFFVDIVNLNAAEPAFLQNAARHWLFIAGWQQDWLDLQKKVPV